MDLQHVMLRDTDFNNANRALRGLRKVRTTKSEFFR